MLQIKNLTMTHRRDLRIILEDFSLVLNEGDKAVVIGEEGNGKSSLIKWLYRPELTEPYLEIEGERILGKERLGYLPQELPAADRGKSVYEFFAACPAFYDATPKELGRMAGDVGVEIDFFYRNELMGQLSGGEKLKAQLLRLLLSSPTVLLLDEPSNDLDLDSLEFLEKMILDWPHIVLFVSHDETLIERTANMVIHLEQLARKTSSRWTVKRLPYRRYVQERQAQFERQSQLARSDRREKQLRDEKYQRLMQQVQHAQQTISRQDPHGGALLKKKMHAVKSMEQRFEREDAAMSSLPEQEAAIGLSLGGQAMPAGKVVLDYRLERLSTEDGQRVLAENIQLYLRGAEKVCIVGANGSGKTTLLRKIAEALLKRPDLTAAYMPQNYGELLSDELTPVEFLDISGDKEAQTNIRTRLGSLKFTADEMLHPIGELSGGQRAKLLLLKLSLSGANVLLLDEPTRNFSPLSGPVLRRMLSEFPGAIISISHDRKYIREVCERVYRLTPSGLKPVSTAEREL